VASSLHDGPNADMRDGASTHREHQRPVLRTRTRVEACDLFWWRGYVTSEFYARQAPGGDVLATSGAFRWRRSSPPPEEGHAKEAYERLVAELRAGGWEQAERGTLWYERRFVREVIGGRPEAPMPDAAVAAVEEPAPATDLDDGPAVAIASLVQARRPIDAVRPPEPDADPGPATHEESAESDHTSTSPSTGRSRRRRKRLGLVVTGLACLLGLAGSGLIVGTRLLPHARAVSPPPKTSLQRRAANTAPVVNADARIATTPLPASAVLVLEGVRGGSWVEVRVAGERGRVVSGFVKSGKTVRVTRRRMWVRFGAAGNLVIRVNGVREPLTGTVDALVSDAGLTKP